MTSWQTERARVTEKEHGKNYLQWQWCNSDNEIRITTHWRKLNLHFFTINCEWGRLVSGKYFVRYEYETRAATNLYSDKSESVEVKKKFYTENQNKYFCTFPHIFLHSLLLFSVYFFLLLFHLEIWNDGWWCADTPVIVMLCENNMKPSDSKSHEKQTRSKHKN